MKRLLALSVSLVMLAGCATGRSPDWVHGNSAQYPANQYLHGRGSADNAEQAQERARADLAKVFAVTVAVDSDDVQTFTRESGKGEKLEQRAERRITTRTEQVVRGIRIAELWQEPKTRTHHALAILPRAQAAASLRQEISALDAAIQRYVQQSREASDLFVGVGAASQALASAFERDGLQRSLKVVDVTGRGIEPEWSSTRLRADLDELVRRVRIAPRLSADAEAEIGSLVRGGIAAAGFVATVDNPEYVLEAKLKLDDLGLRDGWYWTRGTIEITVLDFASNRVRGSKSWPLKASALERGAARQRALQEADATLKKELRRAVIGFAAGG